MKRICAILAFMCAAASAQIPTIKLEETAPLKPLNWCKDSNGVTQSQIEPCGPDTTVGSSISTAQPAVQKKDEIIPTSAPTTDSAVSKTEPKTDSQGGPSTGFWKQWGKWIAFALIAGLLLRWFRRSA